MSAQSGSMRQILDMPTTLDNGNLLLNLVRVDGKDSTKLEFKTEAEKLIYTSTDFGTPGFALWVKPIPNAEAK